MLFRTNLTPEVNTITAILIIRPSHPHMNKAPTSSDTAPQLMDIITIPSLIRPLHLDTKATIIHLTLVAMSITERSATKVILIIPTIAATSKKRTTESTPVMSQVDTSTTPSPIIKQQGPSR